MLNTGHSIKFSLSDDEEELTVTGGPFGSDSYKFLQFHFHWGGAEGEKGSEHTLNGQRFDAEMHMVHVNSKYDDATEAAGNEDGLAVLGFFLERFDSHPRGPTDVKMTPAY